LEARAGETQHVHAGTNGARDVSKEGGSGPGATTSASQPKSSLLFPPVSPEGARRRSVGSWPLERAGWSSPTATCPRLIRPGPVPHVSSLPPRNDTVLASYCSWLAVTTSLRCSDLVPTQRLPAQVVGFEFAAAVVLRVIGGFAVWIGGVRNRGGNSACPLSARDGERLVRVEESVARSSFLVGSMEGNQSCILLGFSLLNCTPERPLARYARVRCSPALLLLPRLPAYCLRLSYAVCQLAVDMLYVVLLRVELDEEGSANLWVF
jgi:hypothetical protein